MENGKRRKPMTTWVYGKVEPGWYCAMWGWRDWYTKQLEEAGYRVIVSAVKPEED
jgi:hypothetical protein